MMNKATLASVALLTEAEAARVFNMGTTRFKARCVYKTLVRCFFTHFVFLLECDCDSVFKSPQIYVAV
jgi:hypothetical protein